MAEVDEAINESPVRIGIDTGTQKVCCLNRHHGHASYIIGGKTQLGD